MYNIVHEIWTQNAVEVSEWKVQKITNYTYNHVKKYHIVEQQVNTYRYGTDGTVYGIAI